MLQVRKAAVIAVQLVDSQDSEAKVYDLKGLMVQQNLRLLEARTGGS